MILGVSGMYCAGKDTAAAYLIEKQGFEHYSLSDFIRFECDKQKIPRSRDNLIRLGNELCEQRGYGVLAELALEKMTNDKNYVITSIRHPGELKLLQTRPDFYLIWLTAPQHLRYDRMRKREADHNIASFTEFKEKEAAERTNNPAKQQVQLIEQQATYVINNSGNEKLLKTNLDLVVSKCSK